MLQQHAVSSLHSPDGGEESTENRLSRSSLLCSSIDFVPLAIIDETDEVNNSASICTSNSVRLP